MQATGSGASRKLGSGLYVVATPIGNLADVTSRAQRILAEVDAVVCEDTRVTGRLMAHLGLRRPLLTYHEHNAERMRPGLLARLAAGERLALVSDAGTPAVSDPGFKLVRAAIEAGAAVVPVPGPSALLAALVASGLPTDRFLFQGFLPTRTSARQAVLDELSDLRATLIFYESGQRLAAMLADCATRLGPRQAVVGRELTKLHEEFRRGLLTDLAGSYAEEAPPRGEIVVLVGPPGLPAARPPEAMDAALLEAAGRLRPRAAAADVAARTGVPANQLYARLLALKSVTAQPKRRR